MRKIVHLVGQSHVHLRILNLYLIKTQIVALFPCPIHLFICLFYCSLLNSAVSTSRLHSIKELDNNQ